MRKEIILGLALIVFLPSFRSASADVVINEFVSDPDSGSEWVELLNTGSSEVDLSGWQWTDLASPGGETEHESSPRSLSGTIAAGGFFVIETTNTLNNTGDSVGLYNGANLENRVTFGSVNGYSKNLDKPAKGKSGAYVSGSWQTNQTPTKGAANSSSDNNENDDNEDNSEANSDSGSSGGSSSSVTKTTATSSKIQTEVSVRNIAYVGIPLAFQGKVTRGTEQIYRGRYFWNFGDGDFREVKVINTDKFTHTYFYPGEYEVIFEHYPDAFAEVPDASQNFNIKVLAPQVAISRVGNERDFFVELANNTGYDANISGWLLLSNGKSFAIPKNTTIAADKKMIISGRTSGLTLYDMGSLKLATPEQEIVFEYRPAPASSVTSSRTFPKGEGVSPLSLGEGTPARAGEGEIDFDSDPKDLSATVANAEIVGEKEIEDGAFSSLTWPAISVGFIGASAFAVYSIRRRRIVPQPGDDFELLDE